MRSILIWELVKICTLNIDPFMYFRNSILIFARTSSAYAEAISGALAGVVWHDLLN